MLKTCQLKTEAFPRKALARMMCHMIVSHGMKTANIRELRHNTSTVLGWVARGERVEITRRNQVVGTLIPPAPVKIKKPAVPDFYSRLEKLFHDPTRPMTGTELVSYGRGER